MDNNIRNFMADNSTELVNDSEVIESLSWDDDSGVMTETKDITVHRVTEFTPLAVRTIVENCNSLVREMNKVKPILDAVVSAGLEVKGNDILEQLQKSLENGEKAQEYLDKNKSAIDSMHQWVEARYNESKKDKEITQEVKD